MGADETLPSGGRAGANALAITDEVLALLCCPETHQALRHAPAAVVAELEAARIAGRLRNRGGSSGEGSIDSGLLRADGLLFFPIREGIPVLISGEAFPLPPIAG